MAHEAGRPSGVNVPRWRWVLGVAVAVGLAGLGVDRGRAGAGDPAAVIERPPPVPASSPVGVGPAAVPGVSAHRPPSASGPHRVDPLGWPFDDLPAEGLQICSGGRATAEEVRRWQADPEAGHAWLAEQEDRLMQRARVSLTRMASRLQAGSVPQQVAARLLVEDVNGAAELAAVNTDPRAYQMALTACGSGRGRDAPACSRLSSRHWAALDPGDARPWLRLLDEAQARGDVAGVDAALAEVAARPRLSPGRFLLESQLVAVADLEPEPALLTRTLVMAIGMDMAMPSTTTLGLMRACVKDPAAGRRLPLCRQSAQQLLAASSDLLDAALAQKLADRVGVPQSAQAYSEARLHAAQEAFGDQILQDMSGLDCAAMKRMSQISVRRTAVGEVGLALEMLERRSPAGRAASGAL